MSYILDALKKSQQEREQRQSPPGAMPSGFQPVFSEEQGASGRPVWLWLIIILLVAVAALLVLLLLSVRENTALSSFYSGPGQVQESTTAVEKPAGQEIQLQTRQAPVAIKTEALAKAEPAAVTKPVPSTPSGVISPEPQTERAAESTTVALPVTEKAAVSEVNTDPDDALQTVQEEPAVALEQTPPYQVLKSIPDLEITGHLYSTLADKRYVNMNGRVWHEGDYISDQIRITSITPEGLILDAGGWKIAVGRSQGWQAIR